MSRAIAFDDASQGNLNVQRKEVSNITNILNAMSLLQYSNEDRKNILQFYGKSQKSVEEDVENLQNWLRKQPHLPEITDKNVIERFLLLNKYRIENVKKVLDTYYTVRSIMPEFYDRNPNNSNVKKIMDIVYYFPLPRLTEDLHRVTILKLTGQYPEDFDAIAFLAYSFHIAEIRLREDYCVSNIFIYDLEGVRIEQLLKFTPMIAKKGGFIAKKVFSSSAIQIHGVNVPSFITPFVTLLKSVLQPKLADRIFLHPDVQSLYTYIPKRLLPKEYGGEEEPLVILNEKWKKKFEEYGDEFERLSKLQVNEHLRTEKLSDTDFYGIEGNFRKLEVD